MDETGDESFGGWDEVGGATELCDLTHDGATDDDRFGELSDDVGLFGI